MGQNRFSCGLRSLAPAWGLMVLVGCSSQSTGAAKGTDAGDGGGFGIDGSESLDDVGTTGPGDAGPGNPNGPIDGSVDAPTVLTDGAPSGGDGAGGEPPDGSSGGAIDGCMSLTRTAACASMTCGYASDGCGNSWLCGTCSNGTCSDGGTCVGGCYAEPALNFGECGYNMTQPFAYACSAGTPTPAGCTPAQTGFVCCPN